MKRSLPFPICISLCISTASSIGTSTVWPLISIFFEGITFARGGESFRYWCPLAAKKTHATVTRIAPTIVFSTAIPYTIITLSVFSAWVSDAPGTRLNCFYRFR